VEDRLVGHVERVGEEGADDAAVTDEGEGSARVALADLGRGAQGAPA
jgi:hypothetical protein